LYAQMARIESVTSAANPFLKDIRRAVSRGGLTNEGYCVAEGPHLLEEALRSDCEVAAVLVSESAVNVNEVRGARTVVLPDPLFQTLTSTVTSQGVIALVRPPEWTVDQVFSGQSLVIVLDGLQDPGNAGAIARAAEAFGATGIMFLKGTVNPFNPKALRASMGSFFRIPFVTGGEAVTLGRQGVDLYAAMPFTGSELLAGDIDLSQRCAIVIGSEGRGVSRELLELCEPVAIPTLGVDSLNAGVAAAILLYEARRQRA
jgi:TrmH family RNA methyltransferase